MADSMVRVRWLGNNSKKYDQKVEDVPAQCVLDEDRPPSVGRTVRVRLGHGERARIWKGTVLQSLPAPSALELALPAKRTHSERTVGFVSMFAYRFMYGHVLCNCQDVLVIVCIYVETVPSKI